MFFGEGRCGTYTHGRKFFYQVVEHFPVVFNKHLPLLFQEMPVHTFVRIGVLRQRVGGVDEKTDRGLVLCQDTFSAIDYKIVLNCLIDYYKDAVNARHKDSF